MGSDDMDKLSLAALLDEDREMVMANLAQDRALPAAQASLEKAVDRVMYRYVEREGDAALRDSAQHILQAMKNALPMIDAVGEARAWKKEAAHVDRRGLQMGWLATLALVAGVLLVAASVLAVVIAGRLTGALALIKTLLPAALGCAALFFAGVLAMKPRKPKKGAAREEDAVRMEYLVDAEKAYHVLRGAMLLADGQLARIREANAVEAQRRAEASPAGGMSGEALELFAQLLENAYASGDEGAGESISAIRFYLHNAQIDVADYAPGRESWFEFLPASRPGTLRPALTANGKLLNKGLASK